MTTYTKAERIQAATKENSEISEGSYANIKDYLAQKYNLDNAEVEKIMNPTGRAHESTTTN